jgi:hypothetical protein
VISPFVTPTIALPTSAPIVILVTPLPTSTPTATPQPSGGDGGSGGGNPSPLAPVATATPGIVPVIGLAKSGGGSVNGLFNTIIGPGEQTSANVILANEGTVDFTYTLSSTPTSSSLLNTNPSQGLQIEVYRCGPSFGLSCNTLIYSGPVVMSSVALGGPQSVGTGSPVNGLHPGSFDYLQLRVTLPTIAGNSLRSTQSVLSFTWTAVQAP